MNQKALLTFIVFLLISVAKSQVTYQFIGGGYTYSHLKNLPRLDAIIDQFNNVNPWMTNKIPHLRQMSGINFSSGTSNDIDHTMFQFAWVGRNGTVSGSGIEPISGQNKTQEIHIRSNTFNIDMGFHAASFLEPGISFTLGNVAVFQRSYYTIGTIPDYTKISNSDFTCGLGLFMKILIPLSPKDIVKLAITPYYDIMALPTKYGDLDSQLGVPISGIFYPPDHDYLGNYGILISLQIGKSKKLYN